MYRIASVSPLFDPSRNASSSTAGSRPLNIAELGIGTSSAAFSTRPNMLTCPLIVSTTQYSRTPICSYSSLCGVLIHVVSQQKYRPTKYWGSALAQLDYNLVFHQGLLFL